MSAFFFKRADWLAALPRLKFARRDVSAASRFAEIDHLLKDPLTDEDRDKAETLRRVWLANHEAGC